MNISDFIKRIFKGKNSAKISEIAYESETANVYYYLLALSIAKNIIANSVSKCDFKFFYNGIDSSKSKEFYRWNIKPNKNQNAVQFKTKLISCLIQNNEALIFDVGDELFIADDYLKNDCNGINEIIFENVTVNSVVVKKSLARSEAIFVQLHNDDVSGLISGVTSSLGSVLNCAINGYKNANASKWRLKIKSFTEADPRFTEKITAIKNQQLTPFMESQNAVFPEFEGDELIKVDNSQSRPSSNIIDLRKDIFTVVANALNIPKSIMLGEVVEDKEKIQFITDCIEPILNTIQTEINAFMFDFSAYQNQSYCNIDVSAISITSINSVANGVEKLISSGVMNIDEARKVILHLSALNTEFSTKYWITKNFEEIEKALKGGENKNEE